MHLDYRLKNMDGGKTYLLEVVKHNNLPTEKHKFSCFHSSCQ